MEKIVLPIFYIVCNVVSNGTVGQIKGYHFQNDQEIKVISTPGHNYTSYMVKSLISSSDDLNKTHLSLAKYLQAVVDQS